MQRPEQRVPASSRWILLWGLVLVVCAVGAYHGSFSGPFIYDDAPAIPDNPTIRHLWPVGGVLRPSPEITSGGRPMLNLTLAVNYAISGTQVWSYHALNLLIHTLAGLALFGIVRRTLQRPVLRGRFGEAALPLALAVAILWTVHPLQTEAVTYIVQRAESLMGLFYLLTLYCFIRGVESRARLWFALSLAACLLGMATKEVMVSAPVMVLLYDRTFIAGSFRAAWKQRRSYYLGLACTWILLGYLVLSTGGNRGGSAGFNVGVSPWAYWLTQFQAVVHYLRLSLWPHPLIFEYGTFWVKRAGEVVPPAMVVILLLAGTLIALKRRPALGFLGAWFFVMLAPTSVVPGTTQMIVEHRMYLSLAAVLALLVPGLYVLLGKRSLLLFAALAVGCGFLTAQRNEDYRSGQAIWSDTVAKRPDNPIAHNNLGAILIDIPGHLPEAMAEFRAALRLKPDYQEAHLDLGTALAKIPGRLPEAITEFEAALRLNPRYVEAHNNLGSALMKIPNRLPEAMAEFKAALRLNPDYPEAHNNLGTVLAKIPGRRSDAMAEFEAALRLDPDYPEAHNNLGAALSHIPNHMPEAIAEYQAALRLKRDYPEAHNNLGAALANFPDRLPEAMAEYKAALQLEPDYAEAHYNLGNALANFPDRRVEAVTEYQVALRLQPDYAEAHYNLGIVLAGFPDQLPAAIAEFQAAVRDKPDYPEAYNNLGNALSKIPERRAEAIAAYEASLRLQPDDAAAHFNLGVVLANFAGRRAEAIAQFQMALQLRPDLEPARKMLDQLQAVRP